MASLQAMPAIKIDPTLLKKWGNIWTGTTLSSGTTPKSPNCFDKKQGMDFTKEVIDFPVAKSISAMLGNIPIESSSGSSLLPPKNNCVELGDAKVVGGIRPQNFDLAYRPDGIRIAYDSKTLNDTKSVQKNWQNMINDLATESATVKYLRTEIFLSALVPFPHVTQ